MSRMNSNPTITADDIAYCVRPHGNGADGDWLALNHFQQRGSSHRPRVRARLRYDADRNLLLRFEVEDRYVRSVCRDYQDSVCGDSCVEFFVQPKPDRGYLNFEMNAGGTLLLHYVTDPTPGPNGFLGCEAVPWELGRRVRIASSLPAVVDPEIAEPVRWSLEAVIPADILEAFVGPLGPLPGQIWRANFYKCGDRTSHPHWAMWSPVGEGWSFHQPVFFGSLEFV